MWTAALEATAKYNVCFPINDWLNYKRELLGIVFKVSILHDADISSCCREASAQCSAFALIGFVKNYSYFGVINFTKEISSSILGAIVHDDNLFVFNGGLFY